MKVEYRARSWVWVTQREEENNTEGEGKTPRQVRVTPEIATKKVYIAASLGKLFGVGGS